MDKFKEKEQSISLVAADGASNGNRQGVDEAHTRAIASDGKSESAGDHTAQATPGVACNENCPDNDSTQEQIPTTTINGRYQLLSLIGTGGMSKVYKAKDLTTQETVALKFITPERLKDEKNIERLQNEADVFSFLSHPNITSIKDFGRDADGTPYLAMNYVDGVTLAELIRDNGAIDPERALNIVNQICEGMKQAHDNGVIHRDLTPSNIILTKDAQGNDHIQILDFGIARVFEPEASAHMPLTETGEMLGTPWYMSPEQCFGQIVDSRTDIYQLGCLIYELLTGRKAFDGATAFEVMYKHVTGVPGLDDVHPEVRSLLAKALNKNPAERFQNVEQLQAALSELPLEELRPAQPADPESDQASKTWSTGSLKQLLWRRSAAAAVDAFVIAALSTLATYLLWSLKVFQDYGGSGTPDFVARCRAALELGLIDAFTVCPALLLSALPERFVTYDSMIRDYISGLHNLWTYGFAVIPLTICAINWIYHALFESSKLRGTPGKILLGLKVQSVSSPTITFWQATQRHFSKILSFAGIPELIRLLSKKQIGKRWKSQLTAQMRRPMYDSISRCVITTARRGKEKKFTAIALSFFAVALTAFSFPWLACATGNYDIALFVNPGFVEAHELRADQSMTHGEFKKALADLDYFQKHIPTESRIYNKQAMAYFQLHEYDKAIAACKQGLASTKDSVRNPIPEDLAQILAAEKNYQQAIDVLHTMNLRKVDGFFHSYCLEKTGQHAQAIENFKLVDDFLNDDLKWMASIGGRYSHESPEKFLNYAITQNALGKADNALKMLDRAIADCQMMEKMPEKRRFWANQYVWGSSYLLKAQIQEKLGHSPKSSEAYKKAADHFDTFLKNDTSKGYVDFFSLTIHGRTLLGSAEANEKIGNTAAAKKARDEARKLGVTDDVYFSYSNWYL